MRDEPKPLFEHLDELRSRIIIVLVVVTVLACCCYAYVERILDFLAKPGRKPHGDMSTPTVWSYCCV